VSDLVAEGHLVPARYYSISEPDLSKVGIVLSGGNVDLDRLPWGR